MCKISDKSDTFSLNYSNLFRGPLFFGTQCTFYVNWTHVFVLVVKFSGVTGKSTLSPRKPKIDIIAAKPEAVTYRALLGLGKKFR